jgi:betaine-aldehyde dehydrogenase
MSLSFNQTLPKHYGMFINGEFVPSLSGKTREIHNPANGELLATVAEGDAKDVDRAVAAARESYENGPWRHMSPSARMRVILKLVHLLNENADYFAWLEVKNQGKSINEARGDIIGTAELFEQYAAWAGKVFGQLIPMGSDMQCSVEYEPIGVCGAITPWNYPLLMTSWKVAPALATGNSMVLKPSEFTPLTTLEFARLIKEAGVPDGVVNFVTGSGIEVGGPLAAHTGVDRIAFTGGPVTGRKVALAAAPTFKRCSLELGGKSPVVVFAESDVERAVDGIMIGIFSNQGEVCSACSRLIIEESVHQVVVNKLIERVKGIVLGDGTKESTKMGPLITSDHRTRVEEYIAAGIKEGAKLLIGGKRPSGAEFDKGNFIEPTVFDGVTANMRIFREEIFGPVLCISTFKTGENARETEANALKLANDSDYGLAAAVYTKDANRAIRMKRALNCGILWINNTDTTLLQLPWGGRKQSGHGRELGEAGLMEYLDMKQVIQFIE